MGDDINDDNSCNNTNDDTDNDTDTDTDIMIITIIITTAMTITTTIEALRRATAWSGGGARGPASLVAPRRGDDGMAPGSVSGGVKAHRWLCVEKCSLSLSPLSVPL